MFYRSSHEFLTGLVSWTLADEAEPANTQAPSTKKEAPSRLTQEELSKMFSVELYGRAA